MKIPFLFIRHRRCTTENGLVANYNEDTSDPQRITYIVKLTKHQTGSMYDARWMSDPTMGEGVDGDYITVLDVDITEETFVFDNDDFDTARREAIAKVKELWNQVEVS